jgi:hypothetical protein
LRIHIDRGEILAGEKGVGANGREAFGNRDAREGFAIFKRVLADAADVAERNAGEAQAVFKGEIADGGDIRRNRDAGEAL